MEKSKPLKMGTIILLLRHGKPVVGNWAARWPSNARDFELNTPVIRELTYLQLSTNDILHQNLNQIGTSILNYYNISYVILHENYMDDKEINFAETFIQKTLNVERTTYENDSLIVYHVKKEPVPFYCPGYHACHDSHHNPGGWWDHEECNNCVCGDKNRPCSSGR